MNELLSGIILPEVSKRVFPEDWKNEQDKKSLELINRDTDNFSTGIHKGGSVVVGAGSAIIDFPEITVAYDPDGKRIVVPVLSGITVPDDTTSKIVIRHKFTETEFESPDNVPSDGPIIWLDNDYEILARQGALDPKDVPLIQLSVASGVVTLETDLRVFRSLIDDQIARIKKLSLVPGKISGGVEFNSTSLPPTLLAGVYEINENLWTPDVDIAFSLSDIIGKQVLVADYWYQTLADGLGAKKVHLGWGESYAGLTAAVIASVVYQSANTYRVTFSGSPDLSAVQIGSIFIGTDTTSATFEKPYRITAVNNGSHYIDIDTEFSTNAQNGNGAHGTGNIAYRVATETTAGNTRIYTPTNIYSKSRKGYYSTLTNFTNWRFLAEWNVNSAGNVGEYIYSYGDGERKNNNYFHVYVSSSRGLTNTAVRRWDTLFKLHGMFSSGFTQSSTLGDSYTLPKGSRVSGTTMAGMVGGTLSQYDIVINSTAATSAGIDYDPNVTFSKGYMQDTSQANSSTTGNRKLNKGDILRVTSTLSDANPNTHSWTMEGQND
ncbi:MAG: hypothetical protein K8R21_01385 [Leptospira sp.]|nr:hypothetical protein [Leptospira sp.]